MRYKDNTRKIKWTDNEWGNKILILLLIVAFPIGLYVMWTESWWKKSTKYAVSAGWALILVLFLYACFGINVDYSNGGTDYKNSASAGQMLGPLQPARIPETTHMLKSKDQSSELISEPTPTPVPTYVYCNDNGVNYHLKDCRYVHPTTPRVTLTQALNAGKTACKICNPPKEETYDN